MPSQENLSETLTVVETDQVQRSQAQENQIPA